MTLLAKIHVTHPDLVGSDVLRACPDATVTLDYQTVAEPDTRYLFLRVATEAFDEFEDALGDDHTLADPVLVAMFADHRVYRVRVETPLQIVPGTCTALGARVLEVSSEGDGWTLRLLLLTRDALEALREYCGAHDVTYRVRELGTVDSLDDEYAFGLTEAQRTALLLAYNSGYYDVPRRVSQSGLAGELGISKSAVSQRLRRATGLLIENTLVSAGR